jgi:hypothetical protein
MGVKAMGEKQKAKVLLFIFIYLFFISEHILFLQVIIVYPNTVISMFITIHYSKQM